MRLLLAEDEKELSDALVAILKHNNYSVEMCIRDSYNIISSEEFQKMTGTKAESETIAFRPESVKLSEERPVSYTHLDVYKRQTYDRRRDGKFCDAGGYHSGGTRCTDRFRRPACH